jgi:excisionase family DNA binding protein
MAVREIRIAMPETIYTIDEAAEQLNISSSTLRKWIKQGKIESFKLGRNTRIHEDMIQAVIGVGDCGKPSPVGPREGMGDCGYDDKGRS